MRSLPLISTLVLALTGCATDATGPSGDLSFDDASRSGWTCEDASWSYGDVVIADTCAYEGEGDYFESHSEIVCESDVEWTWRIGDITYDCDLFDGESGVFTCLYFETLVGRSGIEDNDDYVLVGRFVSDSTAVGAFKFTHEEGTDDDGRGCTVDHDFMAAIR